MNYAYAIANIEKPNYNEKVIKKYQTVNDIIKDLIFCFKNYNYQAEPLAKKYFTGNFRTDAKNIYDFTRREINYDAEDEENQTSRSFSRIIFDKDGDCKHTALVTGSLGWNQGYNVIFRVVEYKDFFGDEIITHIYTILEHPKTKEQIIVDPLQMFNYEKKYFNKIGDYKAINTTNMALSRLTGISKPQKKFLYDENQTIISDDRGRQLVMTSNTIGATLLAAPKISPPFQTTSPIIKVTAPILPIKTIPVPAVPALQVTPAIPSPINMQKPPVQTYAKVPAPAYGGNAPGGSKLVAVKPDDTKIAPGEMANYAMPVQDTGIPMPVKIIGTLAIGYGLGKLFKII